MFRLLLVFLLDHCYCYFYHHHSIKFPSLSIYNNRLNNHKTQKLTPLKISNVDQIESSVLNLLQTLETSSIENKQIYNELLKDCAETGNTKIAEVIIRQMNMLDVIFNQQTYEYLIKSYLNDKSLTLLSAVDEAEIVFKELLRSGHCPSISICTDIIKALGQANLPERAEQIFNKISLLNCLDMDNVEIYNALLAVWSQQCDKRIDALAKTEEILQRMNYIELLPNIHTYEYILQGLLLSRRQEQQHYGMINSVKKAYDLYRSLIINNNMEDDPSHVTSLKIYESIFQICALDSSHSVPLCKAIVLDLSNDMKQRNIPMSLHCYISALQVYCHDYTNDHSAQMISDIYQTIYSNQSQEHFNNSVDSNHHHLRTNIALFWARYSCFNHRNPLIYDATSRALTIISAMHTSNPTIFATVDCYMYLIRAFGIENNMQNVEKYIIDHFVTQYYAMNDHDKLIVSDIKIWNEIISSYYKSSSKSVSLISEAIKTNLSLNKVIQYPWYDNHNRNHRKKLLHLNHTMIKIDNSQIQLQNALERQAVAQIQLLHNVEKVLKVMKDLHVVADSETYSLLSTIYAKAGDFERIKDLIFEMRLRNQTIPQIVYKSFISQLLKSFPSNPKQDMNISISDNSMNSEIELVTKYFTEMCESYIEGKRIENPNSLERYDIVHIEQSFKEMLSTAHFKPDVQIFNSYLNALAVAANTILSLSSQRLSIPISIIHSSIHDTSFKYPNGSVSNTFTYNNLAEKEHTKTTIASLGDKAISVFQDMKKYNIIPTTLSYGLLLRAMEGDLELRRHMIPDRALEIVQYMIASENIDLTPTVDIFETLIRIWVHSKRPDAARVAESIYKTFRSINAAAFDNNYSNTSKYIANQSNRLIIEDVRNFNIHTLLLEVWAKNNLPNAGSKAEDVLENFVLSGLKPTSHMFSLVARSWSKFASVSAKTISIPSTNNIPSSPSKVSVNYDINNSRVISSRRKYLRNRRVSYDNSLMEFDNYNSTSLNVSTILQMQVDYIEHCFIRCVANGLLPEASLYRSVLNAWCQEGSESSISKVEAVLMRVSFLSSMNQDKEKYLPLNISNKLAIPALVDGLNISSLHPSIYTLLASAWKHPVEDAYNFLSRIKREGAIGQQLYIAYNLVLAAYSLQSNSDINVIMAEKFYRETLHTAKSTTGPQLDITATNYLLECIINSNWKENQVYEKCSEIIELSNKILKSQPNDYTVYLMLKCWQVRDCKDIHERALLLFDSMKQYPESNFNIHRNSFVSFIEILSSKFPVISARLLNYLLSINVIPSSNVFSLVLYGASECRKLDLSIELLDKMLKFGYKPDFYSSRSLLIALSVSTNGIHPTIAAERIDQAFTKMLTSGVRATEEMLVLVLQAWLYSRSPYSSYRATEIFRKAMKLSSNPPSVRLYNILINIHGKAQLNNPNLSPQTSENILLYEMKEAGVEPDTVSYNTVISAWGRSSNSNASIRAFNLFTLAKTSNLKLNVITYTSLLSALAKANNESIHSILQSNPNLITHEEKSNKIAIAEYIFEEMQLAGIVPDKMAWNILIGIWCNSYNVNKEENVQKVFERMLNSGCEPTTVTYTTLLNMWASSKLSIAASQIVEIFKRMQQEGQKSDTVSYSSLLSAIGKTVDPESPVKALAVFDAMLASGIKADTTAWTILIGIWSRSKLPRKEDKILEFYDLMRKHESNSIPNSVTYTTMLEMWVRSKHPNASFHILNLYEDIMRENVFLDGYAFGKLIPALQKAYKNSNAIDQNILLTKNLQNSDHLALDKVEQLLMHMVNYKLLPDVLAWNSIMKSDTSSDNDLRILRLYSVMNSLGITSNKATYDLVLYALSKSIQKCDQSKQINMIKVSMLILERMFKEGMLCDSKALNTVLISLSKSSHMNAVNITNDIYKKYIQNSGSHNLIPDNFTANAIMRTYIQNYIYDNSTEDAYKVRFAQVKTIETIISDIIERNVNSSNHINILDISLLNNLLVLWKRSTYIAFLPNSENNYITSQCNHYEYVLLHVEHLFKCCMKEDEDDHIYINDIFNTISTPLISILKKRQDVLCKVKPNTKTYEIYFELYLKYIQILINLKDSNRNTSYYIPKINISQLVKSLNHKIQRFLNYNNQSNNLSNKNMALISSTSDSRLMHLIEQLIKAMKYLE